MVERPLHAEVGREEQAGGRGDEAPQRHVERLRDEPREELERLVAERTAQLQAVNARLQAEIAERRQMAAQLMQADRLVSMGTLAAGVGHEINNPLSYVLTGVEALSELVARGAVEPARASEARALLREVRQGLDRIRQAVRDLKLFSRGGDDALHPLEVAGVLEATLHMAFNDIRHRAQLVRSYQPAPLVLASEARLGQIFLNLVVNASQAIPDGAAEENQIQVSTRTDARGWAVVEIHDTGAGIAPEDLARIFDPFFTTKPLGEGTGLGLAICKNLVEAMGGEIAVESERGKGSAFRVSLPPAPAQAAAAPPPATAPAASTAAPAASAAARRGRVLVVDDDPLVARSIRRVLERDHDVVMETSSRDALGRLQAGERFELLLCDVMMPQLSGPEFHAALVRLAPEQARRVVFVTGGAFTSGSASYLEEVGARTVEKPFEADTLRALAREFC
jgi:signal transduction histidine kinase